MDWLLTPFLEDKIILVLVFFVHFITEYELECFLLFMVCMHLWDSVMSELFFWSWESLEGMHLATGTIHTVFTECRMVGWAARASSWPVCWALSSSALLCTLWTEGPTKGKLLAFQSPEGQCFSGLILSRHWGHMPLWVVCSNFSFLYVRACVLVEAGSQPDTLLLWLDLWSGLSTKYFCVTLSTEG